MNDHSLWRIELARELASYYEDQAGIRMMVLGGSPTTGLSDSYSDLDLIVYWDEIDLAWLKAYPLKDTRGERRFFRPLGKDGVHLETVYFDTLKVDVGHLPLSLWETMVAELLEKHRPDPGILKSLGGFLASIPLLGETLAAQWKDRIAQYPDELARAIIRANLGFFVKGCLEHQGRARGDILFFQDGLCHMLKRILSILGALNRQYFSAAEPRWIDHALMSMDIKPDDAWQRIQDILQGDPSLAAQRLETLTEEVFSLVEQTMPDIDLARIRKGREAMAVLPCPKKPAVN